MDPEYLTFKIIVMGKSRAGKSSLIHSFIKGGFVDDYKPTTGVQLSTKTIKV